MIGSRRAIVFSAAVLFLFTIPVASQSVDIQNSGDGFDAFVDTGFSKAFDLNISEGIERMNLVDSDSRYRVESTPSSVEKKLVTPRGTLEIIRTTNLSLKTVETPYGTLKTGFSNGKNVSTFTGPEDLREKVERIRDELIKNLTVEEREASAKKRVVLDRILPDIEVEPVFTNSSEYVLLSNAGGENVSLKGWKLENSDPDSYRLSLELGPDEDIRLYAGEVPEAVNSSVGGTGVDLDQYEDKLVLENRLGRVIDEVSW
jgi:hypothetical protein